MSADSLAAKRKSCNLNFKTAQKMIKRLLTQERIKTELDNGRVINHHETNVSPVVKVRAYTKEELSKKLNISLKELEKLESPNFCHDIIDKISLPLIRLYCSTKFIEEEYENELV